MPEVYEPSKRHCNIKLPETGNELKGTQSLFEVPLVVQCEDDHSSCCRDSKYLASTTSIRLNDFMFNPLNTELNSICHLLALLAHHIFHVSELRVNNKVKPLIHPIL